jgi:diguanylate cyclase (GGDEF)-like protein
MKQDFPILVVEDDPVSRRLLEMNLTKAGYAVVAVENGRKAIEQFRKNFYPIILTDWMMPEMDGLGLCQAIRQTKTEGYVFIILLTSRGSKDDIVSGLESGADDYLTKPFNQAELVARLKSGIRILNLEKSLKQANAEIKYLSITDPLTECYNRGFLTEHLNGEIQRSMRYGHPLSIVLCDIDFFKKINDKYGHQAGDQVLKSFVQTIRESIRGRVDWVVRYGGEEFLIVLPETNCDGARVMAERLCQKVAQNKLDIDGHQITITASFGGTCCCKETPACKATLEAIVKRADELLYLSKSTGRNKVSIDGL